MTNSKSKIATVILNALLLIVVSLPMGASAIAAPPSEGSYLFSDSAIEGGLEIAGDPTIVRTRFVNVSFDLLGGADALPRDLSNVGDLVVLNLFDDVVFTAALDRVEPNRSGGYSWIGHLEGVEHSQVILVVKDGLMAGNITLPRAFYQVRYAGSGVHAIHEINQSAFPPEAEPIPVDIPDEGEAPDAALADDGSIIDVLVVYTGAARSAAGGTTAMETLIDLAVAETNQSYSNSGIAQRLNLVHTAEVFYDETDFDWSETLSRLRRTSDGYMDNVHTLRDTYCADEVVLLVNSFGYCGLAYLMETVSNAFKTWAFALVRWTCATGNYSFGHELGHNMGARHDWYVDDDTTPYGYAHGYVNTTDLWRTVMAYNDECDCLDEVSPCPPIDSRNTPYDPYCTRLQYWSNPDVTYEGDPMGVPEWRYHPADNRKTLNNTAYTVANWRASCTAPCTDPPTTPYNPSPADGATDVFINTDLTWSGGHPCPGESVTYDVYLEANDSTPDNLICNDVSSALCDPGTLNYDTHHYWKVVANGLNGPSPGPVWDFTTESPPSTSTSTPTPTRTKTPTSTPTPTRTQTPTSTPTPPGFKIYLPLIVKNYVPVIPTATPTPTQPAATSTSTHTPVTTPTCTATATPTSTATPTNTSTWTPTFTPTPTATTIATYTPTPTLTSTPTTTPTTTATTTPTGEAPKAVVACSEDRSIYIIDAATDAPQGPFLKPLGPTNLLDVVVTPDGRTALVSNFDGNRSYCIDLTTSTPSQIGYVPIGFSAEDMALSPDGRCALVTDGRRNAWEYETKVTSIDVPTCSLSRILNIARGAQAVAIAADGETVLVTAINENRVYLLRLNPEDCELTKMGQSWTTGERPINIAISPDGRTALVANFGDDTITVLQIDGSGDVERIGEVGGLPGGQQSIAFSPDGNEAYVVSVNPDPDQLCVLNVNGPEDVTVSDEIDLLTEASCGFFGVDCLAVSPDGRKAYVGNPCVHPYWSDPIDRVTVVDLIDRRVTGQINVGRYPAGIAFFESR